jgi:drug/metabolite transporter (DMT)-like permease
MEPGVLFGLASAGAFGGGDFAGGIAARRVPALAVAAGAQLVGLALLLAAAAVVRPAPPGVEAVLYGALAGAFGGVALAALYAGLSLGSMGLVAALSGVGSVAIPVMVGLLFLAQEVTVGQWLGVGAAVGAGALASGATSLGVSARALRLALVAAVGFGLWFVLLDQAADSDVLWALVASRAAAAALIGSTALVRVPKAASRARSSWLPITLAGALDVTGNAAFVLSTALLPVGVAAALAGLYPITTMLLARAVLREALPPLAMAAVLLAVTGIVLISIG